MYLLFAAVGAVIVCLLIYLGFERLFDFINSFDDLKKQNEKLRLKVDQMDNQAMKQRIEQYDFNVGQSIKHD